MSITDSTATLDTAFTEFDVVPFTAGTLADSSAMITEVESKLQRGMLKASSSPTLISVQRWLVRAKEELMSIKQFTFARRYAYATLASGDYRISLPPDFAGGDIRVKDQLNDRMLKFWPARTFDLKYPDADEESNNKPLVCCIKGMELWLMPPVNASTIIEIEYDRSGDDNTPLDFSFLPEIERFRCCDYALYEACESLENWEKAKWYRSKWDAGLMSSRRADNRRKWKNTGQFMTVFEEAIARNYQG